MVISGLKSLQKSIFTEKFQLKSVCLFNNAPILGTRFASFPPYIIENQLNFTAIAQNKENTKIRHDTPSDVCCECHVSRIGNPSGISCYRI